MPKQKEQETWFNLSIWKVIVAGTLGVDGVHLSDL